MRWRLPSLFASSFVAAALFWGEPEVIVDTARYFTQAKYLELHGVGFFLREWGTGIAAWTDMPLVPFLHGLAFSLFGETRTVAQILTTFLFASTAVLIWLIGRTLWDDVVGGTAAVLLLAMPYLLTQPALMLVDVPTMFFLTLAVYTTIRAVKDGHRGFLTAAPAAISLAILSKYSALLMLSVVPVIVLVHLERDPWPVLKRAAVIAMAAILLIGTAALMKFDVIAEQLDLLWNYQRPGLARWGESHVSTFLFQVHPFVTAAALYSLIVAARRRDRKYAIIAWMLFLVVVLGVKRARYILVTLPMLALMAGYALGEIADGRMRRFVVSCAVVSALVTALFGYLPLFKRMSAANLVAAARYLDGLDVDSVEVFALPQSRSVINPAVAVPILDLLTQKRIVYRGNAIAPPPERLFATSPLRFTWEYDMPDYLKSRTDDSGTAAVAVIVAQRNQPIPGNIAARVVDLDLAREFTVSDEIFRFETLVKVYYTP